MKKHSLLSSSPSRQGESGIIFISFLLLIIILMIGVGALYAFSFSDYGAVLRNEWMTQALYVAEAGIDQKLVQLIQQNTANMNGTLNFDNGGVQQGAYTVFYGCVKSSQNQQGGTQRTLMNRCRVDNNGVPLPCSQLSLSDSCAQMALPADTAYADNDEVIVSTGTLNLNGAQRAQRTLRVTVQSSPLMTPRAAVTIAGVASTNGAVNIDGREHNASGNLTGAPGTYGISTASSTFSQGGTSKVGGNGIAPAKPANPASYEVNGPAVPNNPEAVLGLSSGALDQYKTSTPPASPFSGVVYLTSSWDGVNIDGSSGILICHNSTGDAFLKNIHGTFKGLIITDDLIHINGDATILGAVIGMKSDGVTVGNGSADILFSSSVLSSLPLVNYKVTSWEDSRNDS